MALVVRLKRTGRKNRPHYLVVVTEKRSPRDGSFLEQLGHYDPLKKENGVVLKKDRIEYWMSKGAKLSDTVHSFLKKTN
ncbi:MAG: 30S ribosomal protein S16 [Verrucomicrobiota bacterium]